MYQIHLRNFNIFMSQLEIMNSNITLGKNYNGT
jgi:hypothetical protein